MHNACLWLKFTPILRIVGALMQPVIATCNPFFLNHGGLLIFGRRMFFCTVIYSTFRGARECRI
jgi:hypothetical protein